MMNSSVSPSCELRSITKASALPLVPGYMYTSTVGNVKISRSERSSYCYIHVTTFRIVWWLRNLSLGGKLCLRDDKNTEFV